MAGVQLVQRAVEGSDSALQRVHFLFFDISGVLVCVSTQYRCSKVRLGEGEVRRLFFIAADHIIIIESAFLTYCVTQPLLTFLELLRHFIEGLFQTAEPRFGLSQ